MKKQHLFTLALFSLLVLSLLSTAVSAQPAIRAPPGAGSAPSTVDSWFNSIAQNNYVRFFVGDFNSGDAGDAELFFIKALVFILLVLIVSYAAKQIPNLGERTSIVLLISLIVSLISVRYITSQALVNLIWLPYGVLGIFLATLIPFILGFFFIESFPSRMFRKVAWSLYVVIFAGLAYFRWNDIRFTIGEAKWSGGWVYLATAVLSVIMIAADHWIRKKRYQAHYNDQIEERKRDAAVEIDIRIEEELDKLGRTTNKRTIDAINRKIDHLKERRDSILDG